jgi:hypothetical protein
MDFADYRKQGRLYFCNQLCQDKFHIGPRVLWSMNSNERHICVNAVVEGVIDHQTIAVRFIPYGIQPVVVRIMEYRDDEMELEYDDIRFRFLSAMLDPQSGADGMRHYAICHVNIATVEAGLIHAVVHVPHGCDFNEYNLMVTCPEEADGQPGGRIINLSKVMTEMTFEGYGDHPLTDEGLDRYTSKGESYVGRVMRKEGPQRKGVKRPPMNLHLKKGAFTKQLKQQHKLKGKATRIPESTIQKVLHSKKTSKLERRRAQFAENARHWHHGGRHATTPATPSTPEGIRSKK